MTASVDVLLPVYDGMPYLPDALGSILSQTASDLRVLVLDDGSTDGTAGYLESVDDPRVVVRRWENCGLADTLNRGLALAEAPFVARMDADDVAASSRLANQLERLQRNPRVGALGTQVGYLGARRRSVHGALPLDHDDIVDALVRGRHAMSHPTIVFRREALQEMGGYWDLGVAEDWDLLLRMSRSWRLENLPSVELDYRFHTTSINGRQAADVARNISIAIERHRRGITEPAASVSSPLRPPTWRESFEGRRRELYRRGMVDWLGDHRVRGASLMALSQLAQPGQAVRAAHRRLIRGRAPTS